MGNDNGVGGWQWSVQVTMCVLRDSAGLCTCAIHVCQRVFPDAAAMQMVLTVCNLRSTLNQASVHLGVSAQACFHMHTTALPHYSEPP